MHSDRFNMLTINGKYENGEVVPLTFNDSQRAFLKEAENIKYVCYWGGRGCGKSYALIIRIILLLIKYPNNYGLIGRENYTDLRDTTQRDFIETLEHLRIPYTQNKQERMITLIKPNSKVIFRGLKDITKENLRSLNLGFVGLEQAEEIDESLVDELSASMRRSLKDDKGKEGINQMFILCNPGLNWIYKRFIQEKRKNHFFVKGSMWDNAHNLKQDFIDDMTKNKPEWWQRIFVYGEIDENRLSENRVFTPESIQAQLDRMKNPISRKLDDIILYEERNAGHRYQIGVDPSEGANDSSAVIGVDMTSGRMVAKWKGKIAPDLLGNIVVKMGNYLYGARVVLEINGIGLATLTKLKELNYENIYQREEHDRISKQITKKLGWRTTHASKELLVGNFKELVGVSDENAKSKEPEISIGDGEVIEEMRTFVYSPEGKRHGMGAERSFHDDCLMAAMLGFWEVKPNKDLGDFVVKPKENTKQEVSLNQEFEDSQMGLGSTGWLSI